MTDTPYGHKSARAWSLPIGAQPDEHGTRFRVWAANATSVAVVCYGDDGTATPYPLELEGGGYFSAHVPGISPGTHYMYQVDNDLPRPDPASRWQPEGVHSVSCVVDPTAFEWTDANWRGLPMEDLVIYEVHVGTATPQGTFDALIDRLDDLQDLGITAIELMPVADFPGNHNWGYDGVDLFAPARAYGGPEGLRRLVNAAHQRGLAVLLDVVYNHLGPDGNYLRIYSQDYFTSRHKTPWGDALNMDSTNSRPVREFFIANACYWAHEFHMDGLRLDATHAIIDDSPTHILQELQERVRETLPPERYFVVIAENEENNAHLVRPTTRDGMGLDGVWADDFHHQVRVALAGDHDGYYSDYTGQSEDLATTMRQGWFYTGQPSAYLSKPRGTPANDVPYPRFVHCIQNHDQVGNRALGERLHHDIALDAYRAASVLLLLDPCTPLLFMGQEWAASTPFLYFTDHNEELGRLVTQGRRSEFAAFTSFAAEEIPDPQARETFERSKLRWEERTQPPHAEVLALYRTLLDMRQRLPALRVRGREHVSIAAVGPRMVAVRRMSHGDVSPGYTAILCVVYLGEHSARIRQTRVPPEEVEAGLEPASPSQPQAAHPSNPSTPHHVELNAHEVTRAPAGCRWHLLLDSESADFGGTHEMAAMQTDGTTVMFAGPRALVLGAIRKG